ncbi:uncharacterized protein TNCV_4866461 [Trichonephila clavipes]|nr:uncharacterized protein TNCV_4866461 [Trichonephila clavipes]
MELNDLRHGVVPVSKNLVNDMLICSSDYEVLIENTQMIRNPAKLREPSKKEGIISSTDSKSVCSQEVVTDLLPETQSLLNVPNGDLVAVKINGSNVQTNGQGIKESKGEVVLTCGFKKESCIVLGVVAPVLPQFRGRKPWGGQRPVTSLSLPPSTREDLWLDGYLEYPHAAKALYIYKHPCLLRDSNPVPTAQQ